MPQRQTGWRCCNKCSQLYFGNMPTVGKCAGGGSHDPSKGGNYVVRHYDESGLGQAHWKWCKRCNCLFYGGDGRKGMCPGKMGVGHDGSSSGDYFVIVDEVGVGKPPPYGEFGWLWCMTCEGLVYVGNGTFGTCPSGFGPHVAIGSAWYSITHTDDRRARALDLLDEYVPSGPSRSDPKWIEIIAGYGNAGTTCGFLCHWLTWRLGAINKKSAPLKHRVNRDDTRTPAKTGPYENGSNITFIYDDGELPFRNMKKKPDQRPKPGDIVLIAYEDAKGQFNNSEHVFVFLEEEHENVNGVWKTYWRTAEAGQGPDKQPMKQHCLFRRREVLAGSPRRKVSEVKGKAPRNIIGWLDLDELKYADPPVA